MSIAAARESTPSLLYTLVRCACTVRDEMPSLLEISLLRSPGEGCNERQVLHRVLPVDKPLALDEIWPYRGDEELGSENRIQGHPIGPEGDSGVISMKNRCANCITSSRATTGKTLMRNRNALPGCGPGWSPLM